MDDTTWDQGKWLGGVTVALGLLKWLMGRSRVASADDRYDKRFQEFERKMELAIDGFKRSVRKDIEDFEERQKRGEEQAEEFRRRVLTTVDDLTANLLSLRRAFVTPPPGESHPPSRLR